MTTQKRKALSTTSEQVRLFAGAAKLIKPTKPLKGEALLCFQGIIASRETATWMPHDIRVATELAVMIARLADLTERLADEEPVLESVRGTPVANPIYSVTLQLSNAIQSINRALGLTSTMKVSGAETESAKKRNVADAEARSAIERASEAEGLL